MATLAELRKRAKDMGIAATVIRSADSASELQSIIDDHDGGKSKKSAKRVVKKAVAKKKTAKKETGKKRGRPVGSKNSKKSAEKVKPAASKSKSAKTGKAKRSTGSRTSSYEAKGGRNTLGKVDFRITDGWNPREGSAPDLIIKALKRNKGDREKTFDDLWPDRKLFVGPTLRNGKKRELRGPMPSYEAMLKYRIARTLWDFAMQTGQHESSENRVEYGTGGTGNGSFKTAKKTAKARSAGKASKPAAKKTASKTTRKPASRQKAAQGRTKPATRKPNKAAARKAGRKAAKRR